MDSSVIIEQSGIEFGTSGARGLVTNFTDEVCFAFTLAFLSTQNNVKRIAIAIDNRPSSPAMAQACISAATQAGIEVDYFGVIPTPALAYTAQIAQVPAIMVTGSHIPFDRNGLKFYTNTGEITKQDETAIISASVPVENSDLLPLPNADTRAFDLYIKRYLDVYASDLLKNKKIGIYQHSSAGRDLYPVLFKALGADVVCLGYSDEFVPIDTEAVAETDRAQARKWASEHKLDALFSTDGDGDRPLLADENGDYFTGDALCLLAAKSLNIEALAIPVSCTSSVELTGYFNTVKRTKIGSPYVIAAFADLMNNYSAVAGFEANGGFLLAANILINNKPLISLPTRDAVLPVLATLTLANGANLSDLNSLLPQRFNYSDRLKNITKAQSAPLIELGKNNPAELMVTLCLNEYSVSKVDTTDGVRLTLTSGDIVHLRPSGNAPELRCYTESSNASNAKALALNVLNKVQSYVEHTIS
ncbi:MULTISPECIES: phosphomannomutase [unclassified Pseudoalteromonas]|uniref:phosphomannomutase n=1 Tax=unclassified Pseudoalteromonas TaxID=194690 RepID=UPI001108A1F8|nr:MULTISPECIES: phosphomannomutase [unclassified Pseudoalteromonas]TMN81305.1 phosphomannomutase [Pseudoalteromonas sp. S410]TMN89286.1 phosphomannomutase [Pseudoalteromonas sp. S408]TMN95064.1 phosphomannomutase [Pseudoalteromonas sp. S407]TMN96531.1 phosphomannomutase [Pseudoalteromonas sp. S409]TMO07786.1 phosphomannomutase [Pseudoalteromonas sp. S186]